MIKAKEILFNSGRGHKNKYMHFRLIFRYFKKIFAKRFEKAEAEKRWSLTIKSVSQHIFICCHLAETRASLGRVKGADTATLNLLDLCVFN